MKAIRRRTYRLGQCRPRALSGLQAPSIRALDHKPHLLDHLFPPVLMLKWTILSAGSMEMDSGEERLKALGYKQQLKRGDCRCLMQRNTAAVL
jgi:hypothetical protein